MGSKANLTAFAVAKNVPNYPGRGQAEFMADLILGDALKHYAGRSVQRLLGYWVMVQAFGSFDAYRESGLVSRAAAYVFKSEFLEVFGVDAVDWNPHLARRFPELFGQQPLPFEDVDQALDTDPGGKL